MITLFPSKVIFNFNKSSDIKEWIIVDDVVMGGESSSTFSLNDEGHGVFKGSISLKNNGGFSTVRYKFPKIEVKTYTKVCIRLKGDAKDYQFRIKPDTSYEYSYIAPFKTTGEWQDIEIHLKDMYPSFRGRKLDKPNFNHDAIEEITFLIGNKKEEQFKLELGNIELK